MNSVEALDFAIARLERNVSTLHKVLSDPRRDPARTQADIDEYTAALITLDSLREFIAERAIAD